MSTVTHSRTEASVLNLELLPQKIQRRVYVYQGFNIKKSWNVTQIFVDMYRLGTLTDKVKGLSSFIEPEVVHLSLDKNGIVVVFPLNGGSINKKKKE